jgi:hypothetical protein
MFNELDKVFAGVNAGYKSAAGFGTIEGLAYGIANVMVGAAISITLITLTYAFIQFTMAQGDPKLMQKARNAVFWSLIAMFIAFLSYGVKAVLFKLLGMS